MNLLFRLRNLVKFGVVSKVDNTKKRQSIQIQMLQDEVSDDVPRYQNYGFSSVPRNVDGNGQGAEAIVVSPGGTSTKRIAVVVDDKRYRPKVGSSGDVQIFSYLDNPDAGADASNHRITLDTNPLRIVSKAGSTTIEQVGSGQVNITATAGIFITPGQTAVVNDNFRLPIHSVATLPSGQTGDLVFCTDGNSGMPCLAAYDGIKSPVGWKVIGLGSLVSP